MAGIDADALEKLLPELRQGRALLDGNYSDECSLRAFKKVYDGFISLAEATVFELKEQKKTIDSRDREIADLKQRLRFTGAFVP